MAFAIMPLLRGTNRPLAQLVRPNSTMDAVVFELVNLANAQGWIRDLVAGAYAERPQNPALFAVAQEMGLTSLSDGAQEKLERIISPAGNRWNLNLLREQLGLLEKQVCLYSTGRVSAPAS